MLAGAAFWGRELFGWGKGDMGKILFLLVRLEVVRCVHEHQVAGEDDGDEAEDGAQQEPEVVEGPAFPQGRLDDWELSACGGINGRARKVGALSSYSPVALQKVQ